MTTETRVSECLTCPPWVIRCAHLEGAPNAVALGFKRLWMADHKPNCPLKLSVTANMRLDEWAIYWPSDWWPCPDCGSPAKTAIEAWETPQYFTDEAAALEAFSAAEETFLRGES